MVKVLLGSVALMTVSSLSASTVDETRLWVDGQYAQLNNLKKRAREVEAEREAKVKEFHKMLEDCHQESRRLSEEIDKLKAKTLAQESNGDSNSDEDWVSRLWKSDDLESQYSSSLDKMNHLLFQQSFSDEDYSDQLEKIHKEFNDILRQIYEKLKLPMEDLEG